MKVDIGLSRESGSGNWHKINVELDETDLKRHVYELFTTSPEEGDRALGVIMAKEAFRLLEAEASRMVLLDFANRGAITPEAAKTEIREWSDRTAKIVLDIKARIGG